MTEIPEHLLKRAAAARAKAAGADAPAEAMPQVPFSYPRQAWDSLRARDVRQFAIDSLCNWATRTRDAFRSVRPDMAVTPGWGQGFGWGERMFDPPLASRDQDFTDQHYYGELGGLAATAGERLLVALVVVGPALLLAWRGLAAVRRGSAEVARA